MPKFILSYRSAKNDDPKNDPQASQDWLTYLKAIGPNFADAGWPIFSPSVVVGQAGPTTQLGGYTIVTAPDIDAAVALTKGCPTLKRGGGVEVGLLTELPPDHPAEQFRSRQARK
jgi:hypothetical protein